MPTKTVTDPAYVVNSAIWAAYGDALGFISEGVDEQGLERRLRSRPLDTISWIRKVSRQSPDIELPAGIYSDDTQLRLATSRSIRSDGSFDVDNFSQIELPSWLDYHLGAGLGTLNAAKRLKAGASWNAMMRGDKEGRYVKGGGNGAAMRIQPHVWSARSDDGRYLREIVLNTACTHGHPKAFVGALFHGILLKSALNNRSIPSLLEALAIVDNVESCLNLFSDSSDLGKDWLVEWNRATASSFESIWIDACKELRFSIDSIPRHEDSRRRKDLYGQFLAQLGLLVDTERGSASKTAVAAFAATKIFGGASAKEILKHVAATVTSDTDSIATMSGALLGATRDEECDSPVLDRDYISHEGKRLASISEGSSGVDTFSYEKLPRRKDQIYVGSLAIATPLSDRMLRANAREEYRWCALPWKQTVLLRSYAGKLSGEPSLFEVGEVTQTTPAGRAPEESAHDGHGIARALAANDFDPTQIGRYILNCARYQHGEHLAGVIAYELVKLFRARKPKHVDRSLNKSSAQEPQREEPKRLVRPEPPPAVLQLQLQARPSDSGTDIGGALANYGRRDATDIVVNIGMSDGQHRLTFQRLNVSEDRLIEDSTSVRIGKNTPVVVSFVSEGTTFRQRGKFEEAVGHPDTLLLKGLDIAQIVS